MEKANDSNVDIPSKIFLWDPVFASIMILIKFFNYFDLFSH
jgi:hypothetical protein